MSFVRRISMLFLPLALHFLLAGPASAQKNPSQKRANLVVVADELGMNRGILLLDLMRSRLHLAVEAGNFNSPDGSTALCIYSRRSSGRRAMASSGGGLPHCPMIAAFIDGVRTANAGAYLDAMRASDVESVELLSASDALQRYGASAGGAEALIIWTRGNGPHARPRLF